MSDEKRKKILWLAIILIVVMAVLFLVIQLSDKEVVLDPNSQELVEDQPVFEPKSVDIEYDEQKNTTDTVSESNTEFTVLNLAKSYASRLGSWSTDNPGKNLKELLSLSTSRMKKYLNDRDLGTGDVAYSGITTKSLSAKILSLSGDEAEVLVSTQRIESDENLTDNIFYQDIELFLIKSNDVWFVDEANWLE